NLLYTKSEVDAKIAGIHPVATNGLPSGGLSNQVLAKIDNTDFNADWVTISGSGGGGGGTWGSITGTLSNQTDLQSALDAKVPTTTTVNGHALSANVSVTKSDVGLGN